MELGVCDGAGAVVVASEEAVKDLGLKPLARLVAYATVGVDPSIMGIGPVPAIQNVLKVAGKSMKDIDLIEINEAFAAQTLACVKELKLDEEKLNVDGGAIALGHPLAASGSRITAHLVHELRSRHALMGLCTQQAVTPRYRCVHSALDFDRKPTAATLREGKQTMALGLLALEEDRVLLYSFNVFSNYKAVVIEIGNKTIVLKN
ncbi:hypothetical protein J437_LFUL012831 [Ladona fulva]|uniref:Thiolase C-terminal domain-containing protein n=1 Tax=Ladona fulva TaxID=123851 RepID=A0A8K0KK89_LADFU|nr:hypothetical protein J437_LFUL012831 [Ladona fulva]